MLKHERIAICLNNDPQVYTIEDFTQFAHHKYPEFLEKYVIYEIYEINITFLRPGQKFGADFIVYKEGPGVDHSSFCIQVLSRTSKISSIDVVRARTFGN